MGQAPPEDVGPAQLDPGLRDPLVDVLTTRAAELVKENRALRTEVSELKLALGATRADARETRRRLDDTILRESLRIGGPAGGGPPG